MNWGQVISELNKSKGSIEEMYRSHGLELKLTCEACPEQYDVLKNGLPIALCHLRNGQFRVFANEHILLYCEAQGDGIFEAGERLPMMRKALKEILIHQNFLLKINFSNQNTNQNGSND